MSRTQEPMAGHDPIKRRGGAPPFPLFLLEGQRALLESLTLRPSGAFLRRAPRGDGHPVLVLPGFTAGDPSTRTLRGYLKDLGYRAHPWLLGRNLGVRDGLRAELATRLDQLHRRYGRKVSVVGWSLGGVYARELAKQLPDHVRQVITLGSPFADVSRASSVSRLYSWVAGAAPRNTVGGIAEQLRRPPEVPSTSIFTKTDGVVHWRACLEPETDHTENIAVPGSHTGLGFNPLVLYAVADRLAQPENAWKPFERSGWRSIAYR